MTGKSKVISSGGFPGGGMKGGKGHMFGKQSAGTKKPGITGKADSGGGGKFAKGGNGKMFGEQHASPRKAGITGK